MLNHPQDVASAIVELERRNDLRVQEAIKSAFREMVCDMEVQDIAILELTEQCPAFT
jgi:hypothetical protein